LKSKLSEHSFLKFAVSGAEGSKDNLFTSGSHCGHEKFDHYEAIQGRSCQNHIDTGFGQKPYPGFGTKRAMLVQEGMTYDYLAFKRMICEAAGKFNFFLNLQVMCM
jgi:hypothetical protein